MPLTHQIENHVCIISIKDEPEMGIEDTVLNLIENYIKEPSIETVLFDLEDTAFLNSSGVGKIVNIHKMLEQNHITFILCHLNQKIQKMFKMTQFDRFLKIYPTREEALSAIEEQE